MALFNPASATATVAQNTNSVAIAGMDLTPVQPGMLLYLGARDRKKGDGIIIADRTVSTDKTSGTLLLTGPVDAAVTNAAFLIDTGSYNGSGDVLKVDAAFDLLNAFTSFTSKNSTLYGGNRIVALDKALASNVSQLAFMIGGRLYGRWEQRTFQFTPTGGAQTSTETISLRTSADGTVLTDSIVVDTATGGADALADSVTMVAAALTDLSSARKKKVVITGTTAITSFGPGKHLERLLTFQDAGLVLTFNATSLKLPGGASITTQAGDTCHATSDASGNWHVRSYARADGRPLVAPFRGGTYAALTTGQTLSVADLGRSFSWAVANGLVALPVGSSLLPGWWTQIRFTGNAVGFGASQVATPGNVDPFRFNGRSQFVDTASTNKGFVVIGGGEEFRFTWTGTEWLIEIVQSPAPGFFTYNRFGSGAYASTPTSFTVIPASSTSGSNTAAATPYSLGFYAPCDGLYRLLAATRFYNDQSSNIPGAFGLSDAFLSNAIQYDGTPYKSYLPGELTDVQSRCTKRLAFGQIAAAYKVADNTNLKTAGNNEFFVAELISRG